jgi:hypothetical protein
MVQELSPQAPPAPAADLRQPVTGVTPPELGEARIRESWPSVLGIAPGLAKLGQKLIRSVVLAPLGWLLHAPLFALKLAPWVCKRYTLTNRRLMIQKGWKPNPQSPVQEVKLADIDEVRLDPASQDNFYHSGTLEVLTGGKVVLTLPGVPEPEGFRQAIINAVRAWAPGKLKAPFQPASAIK